MGGGTQCWDLTLEAVFQCFGNHLHRECDFSRSCCVRKMNQGSKKTRASWVRFSLTCCVRTQVLRPQSGAGLSEGITGRWEQRWACRSFGSVRRTLSFQVQRNNINPGKTRINLWLVTLPLLPKQQHEIFSGKYFKDKRNCSFPFQKI